MAKNKLLNINDIRLDLNNYRTVPQKTEEDAIHAMIAIKPERFYAVIESLIDDGYLPTENLIILENDGYTVKEGNRRTAALKLIHGIHAKDNFSIPDLLKEKMEGVDSNWIKENTEIPCSIYELKKKSLVDKIVNLTHAKGEKASRDPWTSVAKARQNRDEKKGSEPALDLLEKYFEHGKNLTNQQKERWSGDYPLSVLDEALRSISPRLGFATISELSQAYPKIKQRLDVENILNDIGLQKFGFKEIRSKSTDFAASYNIPPIQNQPDQKNTSDSGKEAQESSSSNSSGSRGGNNNQNSSESNSSGKQGGSADTSSAGGGNNSNGTKAYTIHDQRTVTATLKKFSPKGNNRQKLVALKDELLKLKVKDNPLAFCFLLRSMFDISASIYCKENSIQTAVTKNGKTKTLTLQQLLSSITKDLTSNGKNPGMLKILHGANTELSKPTGLLSVTSMNQLIHNPSFSIAPHDIFTLFNNVYPLLEAMN